MKIATWQMTTRVGRLKLGNLLGNCWMTKQRGIQWRLTLFSSLCTINGDNTVLRLFNRVRAVYLIWLHGLGSPLFVSLLLSREWCSISSAVPHRKHKYSTYTRLAIPRLPARMRDRNTSLLLLLLLLSLKVSIPVQPLSTGAFCVEKMKRDSVRYAGLLRS